jgi:hypothetical protein
VPCISQDASKKKSRSRHAIQHAYTQVISIPLPIATMMSWRPFLSSDGIAAYSNYMGHSQGYNDNRTDRQMLVQKASVHCSVVLRPCHIIERDIRGFGFITHPSHRLSQYRAGHEIPLGP